MSQKPLLLVVLFVAAACATAEAQTTSRASVSTGQAVDDKTPVVLLIHGGGWLFGSPEDMERAGELTRSLKMQPILVRYPLGDPFRATRVIQRLAIKWNRRGRTVYAYGESVGGTMAEMLAADCLVDAAVANSAPPDLMGWPEPNQFNIFAGLRPLIKQISPFHQPQCSSVLTMHSRQDGVVNFRFAADYAARFAVVHLREIDGGHIGRPYGPLTSAGLRWLLGRKTPPGRRMIADALELTARAQLGL